MLFKQAKERVEWKRIKILFASAHATWRQSTQLSSARPAISAKIFALLAPKRNEFLMTFEVWPQLFLAQYFTFAVLKISFGPLKKKWMKKNEDEESIRDTARNGMKEIFCADQRRMLTVLARKLSEAFKRWSLLSPRINLTARTNHEMCVIKPRLCNLNCEADCSMSLPSNRDLFLSLAKCWMKLFRYREKKGRSKTFLFTF